MNFANKSEFKRFIEADAAFFVRREARKICREAKKADPNVGFRLDVKNKALASRMKTAADRMVALREEEKRAKSKLNARDLKIAGRSVEAMHRRTGRV